MAKISRRIEVKTLMKVLRYSMDHGAQKKTNMATNCKMSYSRLIPLLNIMYRLDLMETLTDKSDRIAITEFGKEVLLDLEKNFTQPK